MVFLPVGVGFQKGFGAPDWRFVSGIRIEMPAESTRKTSSLGSFVWYEPLDSDEDGFYDSQDSCPSQAETTNGHEDTDGCPDTAGKLRQIFPK